MIKTSVREKAKQLLVQGYSKTEVASRCGVSRRTVIRWSQQKDFIEAIENGVKEILAEFFDGVSQKSNPMVDDTNENANTNADTNADTQIALRRKAISVEQRIDDLFVYQESQMNLAASTENAAFELLGVCESIITQLQQNPSEISPRMLPQIVKAANDLSKVSNDCWTRAMDAKKLIEKELQGGALQIRNNDTNEYYYSPELAELQFSYYPPKWRRRRY